MRGNNTTIFERSIQQLKIRFLKETLCWPLGVTTIRNDDIELILLVSKELETVTDVCGDIWVLETEAHAGQVFFGEADDGLVDVAQDGVLDGGVLDYFAEDAAVTATDDEDGFRVGVRIHGEVGDHFLVAGGFTSFSLWFSCLRCGVGGLRER